MAAATTTTTTTTATTITIHPMMKIHLEVVVEVSETHCLILLFRNVYVGGWPELVINYCIHYRLHC